MGTLDPGQVLPVSFQARVQTYQRSVPNSVLINAGYGTLTRSVVVRIGQGAFLPGLAKDYAPPWYAQDFSKADGHWPITHNQNRTVYFDYGGYMGEYRINLMNQTLCAGAVGFRASDYVLAADINNNGSGTRAGLLFGGNNDLTQFYYLQIGRFNYAPSPGFQIWSYNAGRPAASRWMLLSEGASAFINLYADRLVVERQGSSIQAFANGGLLSSIDNSEYTGTRGLGLMTCPGGWGDTSFDNFRVYPPRGQPGGMAPGIGELHSLVKTVEVAAPVSQ
jgi:hypothetical protein